MSQAEHRAAAPRHVVVQVVTLSDTRVAASDTSGALLRSALEAAGHDVRGPRILQEDPERLPAELAAVLTEPGVDAVVITGGTGLGPRDLAADVLGRLYTRTLPGFGELFRTLSYGEIGAAAWLSRASAGVVGDRLVFSIPGSRAAVQLAVERLLVPELAHAVGELRGRAATEGRR